MNDIVRAVGIEMKIKLSARRDVANTSQGSSGDNNSIYHARDRWIAAQCFGQDGKRSGAENGDFSWMGTQLFDDQLVAGNGVLSRHRFPIRGSQSAFPVQQRCVENCRALFGILSGSRPWKSGRVQFFVHRQQFSLRLVNGCVTRTGCIGQ